MATSSHRFSPGERVTPVIYGKRLEGAVVPNPTARTGGRSSLVWVQWDGRTSRSWYHPESLTPLAPRLDLEVTP